MEPNPAADADGPSDEIAALVRRLHETQQRLRELLGGEVDAVVHPGGQTYLLHEAQEKLRQNEAAQRAIVATQTSILDALPAHIALIDHDGVIISVNESWRHFGGIDQLGSSTAGLGQNYLEACDRARGSCAEEAHQAAAGIRAVLSGATKQFALEYPLHSLTGQQWFRLMVSAIEKDGREGAVVMHIDVTARIQAEEAVRESEERFRLLAKATNDAIWDWNIITDGFWWNDGLETLFGYRSDEVEPTIDSWLARIHPEDRVAVMSGFHQAIETGKENWSDEYRFFCKSGSYAYVLDRGYIIRDADGKPLRMIGGMTDLTERKNSEERIAEQAALIDQARDAILVRNLENRVLFWSKGAERLFGWRSDEAVGRTIAELIKPDPEISREAITTVLRDGAWSGEIEKVTKAGAKLTLESRWTLLRDSRNQPKSVLEIGTDITGRKRIERQILRAQRMESVGTLAGGIAHDLNNVLGPILMSIDLLKMKFPDEASQGLLRVIGASAQHGADMVQRVLSFARGVEGRRMQVQIEGLVHEIEKFANETFLKHIRVRSILPAGLWSILGDPTQIHQVLLNLCVNARDAMPDGGTLTISATNVDIDAHYAGLNIDAEAGRYVQIGVEDTGTGMPPEIIEKIFDPFFTTKEVGKGTGLGLATSLAIIKSHGGFIRVYSEAGKGTTFHVYLPAQIVASMETPASVESEAPRGNGELILIVDDEFSIRQITQETLEAFGYRVIVASDGAEAGALYASRGREIAAMVTDMMMPGIDGAATIQILRKMNPKLQIIASSGLSTDAQVARTDDLGVKHFLSKPYTAKSLLNVLRQSLSEQP